MNLDLIRPRSDTEDILLSIIKICEKLLEQTHRKAEETLEFKLTQPKETFSFTPPIAIEGSRMLGLSNLEVYKSSYNIMEANSIFELYTDTFDEFSFTELKDELEDIVSTSDITLSHLQH